MKVILYVIVSLVLGLLAAYESVYFLHPLSSSDWYRYGFPLGWKNMEATGFGYDTPTFTFYNPTGFVLDVLFWFGVTLTLVAVATCSLRARNSHS